MPVGDGISWDETTPTNATLATSIDDYDRDIRIGVRSRLALEHEWPASQSSTAQAGQHKFITLQNQAAKPTVSGTQLAAVYSKTVGAGLQELFYENEAGTEVQMTSRGILNSKVITFVSTFSNTVATGTTIIPYDDTIPQITEGDQYLTVSITPKSATNTLLFHAVVNMSNNNSSVYDIVSLFQGTTASAIASSFVVCSLGQQPVSIPLSWQQTVSTTGAISYSIRAGGHLAGVTTLNGVNAARQLGGSLISSLEIYEVQP